MIKKRGQVTIFIIIAVIIVAGVAGYFVFRNSVQQAGVPTNMQPVYNAFLTCIEQDTQEGLNILGVQGGYIYLPDFEAGSAYSPFSSQLNFLGTMVPYWYYISGNGIAKDQIPSRGEMEDHLATYLESEVKGCFLDEYFEQGFGVSLGEPKADVTIREGEVEINLEMPLGIQKANQTAIAKNHNVVVKSNFGSLYDSAREIYDYEQETFFLENYGIDVLRVYAPVDGVELTCSPLVWSAEDVFTDVREAVEQNTAALRGSSNDYELVDEDSKYFVVDLPTKHGVRFINSRNWSSTYEVDPASDVGVMIAKPVGNQPGMAILGFCYVPYHFVYSASYPTMIQVFEGEDIFQFPVAVVIRGNKPREALDVQSYPATPDPELCRHMNTPMQVNTYDNFLNPVLANVSFECFGQSCPIGNSDASGMVVGNFPQCANGFVVARAEGYARTRQQVSTTIPGVVDVILGRLYEKEINLQIDGKDYNKDAIITFTSEGRNSQSIVYPEQKKIELVQGQYEIEVTAYKNVSVKIEETKKEECMDVPREGLGAIFGLTQERCFDIVIPGQTINNALHAGGKQEHYIIESELETSTIIDISVDSLPIPRKIEDLQINFALAEGRGLDISLR